MLQIKFAVILSGALAFSLSLPANSAVYKCKDKQGHVSYSQMVCPEEAEVDKIIKLQGGRKASERDVQCGLVKSFAAEVGIAINKKQNVNDLYARYGGMKQLSPTALKIIRSVYDYQSKPYKTVQNSVEHEKERCLSEIYGVPDCSEFPLQFITSYGGCSQAADTNLRLKRMSANSSDSKLRSDNNKTNQRVASAANAARKRQQQSEQEDACKASVKMAIRRNESEARGSLSASEQDQLRQKRRSLKERLSRCSK